MSWEHFSCNGLHCFVACRTTVAILRQQGRRDLAYNLVLKPGRTIWVLFNRHENYFPAALLQLLLTTVDTFLLAIAGLEGQVSDLQEALADAKSANEQAVSSQQAAGKGAAEAQELRREVADLRKTLDDRQTELKSIKACASTCWKLCSSSLSRCPCMVCAFCMQATPLWQGYLLVGFQVYVSDSTVLMSKMSVLMLSCSLLSAFVKCTSLPGDCLGYTCLVAGLGIWHMWFVLYTT